ncbi:MAG: hypothetical protein HC868_13270 [Sphingomonadales bacterium]|nr:hypothetical protein [Sphingomonadales bacterium]
MHKSLLVLGFCFSLGTTANAQPAAGYSGSGYATSGYGSEASPSAAYRNERFGFELAYPSAIFEPGEAPEGGQGMVFISRDGAAQLLVSAGQNTTGETLGSYRRFVLSKTYADARIEYAPVRDSWFVLSGTNGDTMFYERITFRCGGKVIYGWQMTYPVAERRTYDPIVEAVHRSYRPGNGEGGRCG